jgi:hypothetical protein
MKKKDNKKKRKRKSIPSPLLKKLVSRDESNILSEAEYIINRAQQNDSRIVIFGPLIFFSTETGDSWVLDPEDKLALCLSRDGEKQDFMIKETKTNFGIEWKARYQIQNKKFIVYYDTGEIRTIIGYPVEKIISMSRYPQNRQKKD